MSKLMTRVGFYALELLNEQIDQGTDADGNPYEYSARPFARPIGGIKDAKNAEKAGKIKPFRTKEGKLWAIVTGGYKSFRELSGKNPEGDFLTFTGALRQSLSSRSSGDTEAQIYSTDPAQAQKIFWLSVAGAGKARKKWDFFRLSDKNLERLAEYAAGQMTADDIQQLFKL